MAYLHFRATDNLKAKLKFISKALYDNGLRNDDSMTQYAKDAINEKIQRDQELLSKKRVDISRFIF